MGTTPNGLFYPDASSQVGSIRSHIQQLAETADAAIGVAWTTFTPVWTAASGTAPSLGNGSWDARWVKVGKTVHFSIVLLWGTTTTGGSGGQWRLTIPFTPRLSRVTFQGELLDAGVAARPGVAVWDVSQGAFLAISQQTESSQVPTTNTSPFTWGNTDRLYVAGTCEVA